MTNTEKFEKHVNALNKTDKAEWDSTRLNFKYNFADKIFALIPKERQEAVLYAQKKWNEAAEKAENFTEAQITVMLATIGTQKGMLCGDLYGGRNAALKILEKAAGRKLTRECVDDMFSISYLRNWGNWRAALTEGSCTLNLGNNLGATPIPGGLTRLNGLDRGERGVPYTASLESWWFSVEQDLFNKLDDGEKFIWKNLLQANSVGFDIATSIYAFEQYEDHWRKAENEFAMEYFETEWLPALKQRKEAKKGSRKKKVKLYRITTEKHPLRGETRTYTFEGTLEQLVEAFQYTLECGKSYEHEKGNKKINLNPKTIDSLCKNVQNAHDNSAANGYGGYYLTWELIGEDTIPAQ